MCGGGTGTVREALWQQGRALHRAKRALGLQGAPCAELDDSSDALLDRQPKVDELDVPLLEHHILELDVGVAKPLRVEQRHRARQLVDQRRRLLLLERSVIDQRVEQLAAAHKLHHDVEGGVVLVEGLERGDARVHRYALQHLHLVPQQVLAHLLSRHALDGDETARLLAPALAHDGERALAQLRSELVVVLDAPSYHLGRLGVRQTALENGARRGSGGGGAGSGKRSRMPPRPGHRRRWSKQPCSLTTGVGRSDGRTPAESPQQHVYSVYTGAPGMYFFGFSCPVRPPPNLACFTTLLAWSSWPAQTHYI